MRTPWWLGAGLAALFGLVVIACPSSAWADEEESDCKKHKDDQQGETLALDEEEGIYSSIWLTKKTMAR